ncbi:MAG: hypothetical protein GX796_04985, partial [Clostridiaceae bacterium]|nr:hypothetical protein [Clostridiaceae bacterium]
MVESSGEKKKRGRPKKNSGDNYTPIIQTVKRGRGRPKKIQSEFSSPVANIKNLDSKDLNYKAINVWDNSTFKKRSIVSFCDGYKT